jgi:phospholipid/cholesterol/gamma-HCH transport system substrate-binding protein
LPPDGDGPYLRGGETLSMDRNSIPTATQTLLMNIDQLARSVDASDLATTVQELGYAFNDRGVALGSLLDSTNEFVDAASANLSPTVALIDQSATVLRTQLDEASSLRSFTASLDLLARQLKTSDRDVRRLLDSSPQLSDIRAFIQDNRTDLGVTIANLADIGDLLVQHRDGFEEVLELYPALAAGGPTIVKNGKGGLGLVSQTTPDPRDCGDPKKGQEGYQGTTRRDADVLTPIAPNVAARCTAPLSSGINVRGSANVPGGDPIAATGGGVPYPRVNTSNMLVGTHLESAGGARSWKVILTDALR